MGAGSLLVTDATIITGDTGDTGAEVHERADILVENGVISAIGSDLPRPRDAEIIDGSWAIAIPGFVDGHRHMWEGLLRGAIPDADIDDYFQIVNGKFAPAYTARDAYLGELITALGALDAGVTTVLDWSHVQTTPAHTDGVLEALRTSGIRAVFAFGPPGSQDQEHQWPQDVRRLRDDILTVPDDRITLGLATFSPEHQPWETALDHYEIARNAGALITIHAGLNGLGEPGQIERLARAGHLGPDVNLVHCNTLSPAEWSLIAETGASVSITPSTEMQMGQGIPPLRQALAAGILPSFGIDVEVASASDMWTQLRIAFAVERSQILEDKYQGKEFEKLVTTGAMFSAATLGGARACLLEDRVGTLAVGKRADIVLLRSTVHTLPINDLVGTVVHNMDARNVDTVVVDGRVVKRDGRLVGVDLDDLRAEAYDARERVFAAAGVTPGSGRRL